MTTEEAIRANQEKVEKEREANKPVLAPFLTQTANPAVRSLRENLGDIVDSLVAGSTLQKAAIHKLVDKSINTFENALHYKVHGRHKELTNNPFIT